MKIRSMIRRGTGALHAALRRFVYWTGVAVGAVAWTVLTVLLLGAIGLTGWPLLLLSAISGLFFGATLHEGRDDGESYGARLTTAAGSIMAAGAVLAIPISVGAIFALGIMALVG